MDVKSLLEQPIVNETQANKPIKLSPQQEEIRQLLQSVWSEYPLAEWYYGAIYAINNIHNPDCFAQAANSLREVLEKLAQTLPKYKNEYKKKRPSGRGRSTPFALPEFSPIDLDKNVTDSIIELCKALELITHHSHEDFCNVGSAQLTKDIIRQQNKKFEGILDRFKDLIFKTLGEIAKAYETIKEIVVKPKHDEDDIKKLIHLIVLDFNRDFFFKETADPSWIKPLDKHDFFKKLDFANIYYLEKVAEKSPKQVVDIICNAEETSDLHVLHSICTIARLLDANYSLRLKHFVKKYFEQPSSYSVKEIIVDLAEKWELVDIRELICGAVAFQPDPREDEKCALRKKNPRAYTQLNSVPRFSKWEYKQILEEAIRPLAEREPYWTACILIEATVEMIKLKTHEDQQDKDYLEPRCPRLDKSGVPYTNNEEDLVHTLTYACQQVYATQDQQLIDKLDKKLRQPLKLFERLRQHLYRSNLSEQTLPWIREFIMGSNRYAEREHRYEFQCMVRQASEHFGKDLLNEDQLLKIFNDILSGPSKEDYREWVGSVGKSYNEEDFQKYKRSFHYRQIRPFALLFSKVQINEKQKCYFDELENDWGESIDDDSYFPPRKEEARRLEVRSPITAEDLAKQTDDEILGYLNNWEESFPPPADSDYFTAGKLAEEFQTLFLKQIIPNQERLSFWITDPKQVKRPIYITAMVRAMGDHVKNNDFDCIEQWFEFYAWILSHLESREDRSSAWKEARRAVVDFIRACVRDDSILIKNRQELGDLLRQVCTQADSDLDNNQRIVLNEDNPITEAINNTRSWALGTLILFGYNIRRCLPEDPIPEVTDVLSARMSKTSEVPLTGPEHAILGEGFGALLKINRDWTIKHSDVLFPRRSPFWHDAFGSHLVQLFFRKTTFDILQKHFKYALDNLDGFKDKTYGGCTTDVVVVLGIHLFFYYLENSYSLKGADSLLARFYERTSNDKAHWRDLFSSVGEYLLNPRNNFDSTELAGFSNFLAWRLKQNEVLEFTPFYDWLEAECLEPKQRLDAYLKVLELRQREKPRWQEKLRQDEEPDLPWTRGLGLEVRALNKLREEHPDHLLSVIKCFKKITNIMNNCYQIHTLENDAKSILRAGLNSDNDDVKKIAKQAQNNLLEIGCSSYLNVDEAE